MYRSAFSILVLLASSIIPGGTGRAGEMPRPGGPTHSEYLVGVYYFSGWWRAQPNKYFTAGRDWRAVWPGRRALLGEYNEQETMDREIVAAAGSGIDFFQILWYSPFTDPGGTSDSQKLNEGLRLFMASTNSPRMKFTVECVNHPPFQLDTDSAWEAACRTWCAAMKHPSYLRVGGRPIFKVHGADYFFTQNGRDPARVAARLATLRRIAHESRLPEPLISAGVGVGGVATGPTVAAYDFLTTYMEMPNLPQVEKPYPYETLLSYAEEGWRRYARLSEKPYVPYVPAGWDPRPWKDSRASFEFPDREQWVGALHRVKAALDSSPRLGVPLPGGKRQKMLLIYAWNEFGEGGIVAPTQGGGEMKLKAIASVFGGRPR